jgi:hypothetical protein
MDKKKIDEIIQHVGVLGMHWGVRKSRSSGSKTASKQTKTPKNSEDHDEKVALKQKKLNTLSNAELKKLNERMQLEKSYKDLSKNELSAGAKLVQEILGGADKETAKNFAAKQMLKGVEKAFEKKATT